MLRFSPLDIVTDHVLVLRGPRATSHQSHPENQTAAVTLPCVAPTTSSEWAQRQFFFVAVFNTRHLLKLSSQLR